MGSNDFLEDVRYGTAIFYYSTLTENVTRLFVAKPVPSRLHFGLWQMANEMHPFIE
jgi:hypothetical protein